MHEGSTWLREGTTCTREGARVIGEGTLFGSRDRFLGPRLPSATTGPTCRAPIKRPGLSLTSRIDVEDLPEEIGRAVPASYFPGDVRPLEEVERDYILAVIRANDGNRAHAAEQLKIGTATLYRKLKQYEATSGHPKG
jgi:hypothetical protein